MIHFFFVHSTTHSFVTKIDVEACILDFFFPVRHLDRVGESWCRDGLLRSSNFKCKTFIVQLEDDIPPSFFLFVYSLVFVFVFSFLKSVFFPSSRSFHIKGFIFKKRRMEKIGTQGVGYLIVRKTVMLRQQTSKQR